MTTMRKTLLRTDETHWRYVEAKPPSRCFMCEPEPELIVIQTEFWQIIDNQFPYDAIAMKHHLLVPKRHVANEESMTQRERFDLIRLFWLLEQSGRYDSITRNMAHQQSCPQHLHYHLLSYWVV